jgi:hypothetical protein
VPCPPIRRSTLAILLIGAFISAPLVRALPKSPSPLGRQGSTLIQRRAWRPRATSSPVARFLIANQRVSGLAPRRRWTLDHAALPSSTPRLLDSLRTVPEPTHPAAPLRC